MSHLKKRLSTLIESPKMNTVEKLEKICHLLNQEIPYFNWVGFYFKNGDKDELVLGPYVGAATEHTIIPYGRGICGQVAISGQTLLVPDVRAEDNYLACSIETKAELVVPIFKNGKNIGQVDIDSHSINPFTQEDRQLMEWLCGKLPEIL